MLCVVVSNSECQIKFILKPFIIVGTVPYRYLNSGSQENKHCFHPHFLSGVGVKAENKCW